MADVIVRNLNEVGVTSKVVATAPESVDAQKKSGDYQMLLEYPLGGVLGGSILVETIFDYPGMGRLMGEASGNRDFPLLQTLLLFIIVGVLVANLIADMLYGVLDPRARKAES